MKMRHDYLRAEEYLPVRVSECVSVILLLRASRSGPEFLVQTMRRYTGASWLRGHLHDEHEKKVSFFVPPTTTPFLALEFCMNRCAFGTY